jgi:hypothetical protein
MHGEEIILLVFVLGGLVFLIVLMILRYRQAELRHQERMQVIERGGVLPSLDEERPKAPWTPRTYLLRGMIWLYTGIAIAIMFAAISLSGNRPPSAWAKFNRAQEMRHGGANEEVVQQYLKEMDQERDGLPLGAATVGLIPMGVGLAYLMFYRKETQTPETPRDAG